ncbi:MAG: thioesterase family protein [Myxococcota bacterium]
MPPFRHSLPVRFADIDHAGIVYYPRFFHYFHIAFEEFWRERLGARAYVDLLDRDRIGFPAVRSECEYKAPLRFGDTMDIELTVARLGGKSVTFRYQIYRASDPPGSADSSPTRILTATGSTVCAVVDLQSFQAVPIPDRVRALLQPLAE